MLYKQGDIHRSQELAYYGMGVDQHLNFPKSMSVQTRGTTWVIAISGPKETGGFDHILQFKLINKRNHLISQFIL